MTALAEALTAAGHVSPAVMPQRRPEQGVLYDPMLRITFWNHHCLHPTCVVWVPNHLAGCSRHPEETS